MEVLVHNDMNGHCNVYDVNSETKKEKCFKHLINQYIREGYFNEEEKKAGNELLVNYEYNKAYQLIDGSRQGFDKSNGGVLYITKVEKTFENLYIE